MYVCLELYKPQTSLRRDLWSMWESLIHFTTFHRHFVDNCKLFHMIGSPLPSIWCKVFLNMFWSTFWTVEASTQ